MITDVAISLSRKRQDKVNGTGRFHIMKNRYGMDGMTFGAKIDTSTGHFDISDESSIDDDEETMPKPQSNRDILNRNTNFDELDRQMLANKFFNLSVW